MPDDIQIKLKDTLERLITQKPSRLPASSRLKVCATHRVGDIHANISRQLLDDEALEVLLVMAKNADFVSRRTDFAKGEAINVSENRAALHPALRANETDPLFSKPYKASVQATQARMAEWVRQLQQGQWLGATGRPIRHLVHIGIGGSCSGALLACTALSAYDQDRIKVHFVSDVDGHALSQALTVCPPEETLFIAASKSFGTKEVLVNLGSARHWMLECGIAQTKLDRHFVAITAQPEKARALDFASAKILSIPEWVGGRYSIWSAMGLSVAAQIGMEHFHELLSGARLIDQHFFNTPAEQNLPLLLALVDIWNVNGLNINSQLILPYAHRLTHLPTYLQQLQMESAGKNTSVNGTKKLTHRTSPVLWGDVGTAAQHTFFQLLYEGTEKLAIDYIFVRDPDASDLMNHQSWLVSAGIGHAEALSEHHFSTYLVLPALTPSTLGQLLAIYEHKVFCQGLLWDLNPFDQFGVEQGKALADEIYTQATKGQQLENQTSQDLLQLVWQNLHPDA